MAAGIESVDQSLLHRGRGIRCDDRDELVTDAEADEALRFGR
jgi:hypothetical protein